MAMVGLLGGKHDPFKERRDGLFFIPVFGLHVEPNMVMCNPTRDTVNEIREGR